jgi:hypothetical protein
MPLFTGTQACIFTELLEGRTLRQTLEDERLAISRAVDIAAQVADGLAAAHRHGDEPGTVPDSLAQYQGRFQLFSDAGRAIMHIHDRDQNGAICGTSTSRPGRERGSRSTQGTISMPCSHPMNESWPGT